MKDTPTTSVDISHHIQRGILLQLRQNGTQTYQQLKPDGVEGNAYNYHLRNLKQANLINSDDKAYDLTPMGQVVADSFSFQSERLVLRPHVYTHLIVTSGDSILLYHPTRQPLPGVNCLPSGKMHYGDSYETSITRELERRNLTNEFNAQHLCAINMTYEKDGHIVVQRPGNLWHIQYSGPLNESETPSGSAKWWSLNDIDNIPNLTPEVTMALERIRNNSFEPIEFSKSL